MEKWKDVVIWILVVLFYFFLLSEEVSAASLFDVSDENSPFYPEIEEEEPSLPDYAINADGDMLINNDTTLNEVLVPDPDTSDPDTSDPDTPEIGESVSGGDVSPGMSVSDMQALYSNLATLSDMEALLEDSLADTKAANLSVADAYLSSAIVDVFSRVVDGIPSWYDYVAYRLNPNDASEGYLLYSPDAKVSGNQLEFFAGSYLCHYYRVQYNSGYQTYYNYKYDVTEIHDVYRVPYKNGQLIYTNMVPGFPTLSENNHNYIASWILPVFIVAVCLFIIIRRKK